MQTVQQDGAYSSRIRVGRAGEVQNRRALVQQVAPQRAIFTIGVALDEFAVAGQGIRAALPAGRNNVERFIGCLLYTSDAADE